MNDRKIAFAHCAHDVENAKCTWLTHWFVISVGTLTVELFAYILSMTASFQVLSESVLINLSAIGLTTQTTNKIRSRDNLMKDS